MKYIKTVLLVIANLKQIQEAFDVFASDKNIKDLRRIAKLNSYNMDDRAITYLLGIRKALHGDFSTLKVLWK